MRVTLLGIWTLLVGILTVPSSAQTPKEEAPNPPAADERLLPLLLQEQELREKVGPEHPQLKIVRKQIETAREFLLARQDQEPAENRERRRANAERGVLDDQARQREVQEQISQMRRRIEELREANKTEEATALQRELQAFVAKAQAEIYRDRADVLRRQIEELRNAGRIDEARRLEFQLKENQDRARVSAEDRENQGREGPRDRNVRRGERFDEATPPDLERRVNLLRQAAENLMAAGLPDQAGQLMRQAEELRMKLGEPTERRSELHELHQQIRQQNERIEQLEQTVRALIERIERRDNAAAKESDRKRSDDGRKE